jgi:membrane-anchored protein YejM (alkaline phosphatase superfamily)
MVISLPLFREAIHEATPAIIALQLVVFVSHYFMLNLALGLAIALLSTILSRRPLAVVSGLLFLLLQMLLIIDVRIYTIFHYHINALVWNLLTTEGVSDSVMLGKNTVLTFSVFLVLIFAAETFVMIAMGRLSVGKERFLSRASKVLFFVCLAGIAVDKATYAYANIVNNTKITQNVKLYPLYQPLTINRFARKVLHINVNREKEIRVNDDYRDINYPKELLRFDPERNRKYNVIVLAVEGLRFDMLDPEIMPNTWKFSRQNLAFKNHYSGGNGSRFGIFSLFYGIHGSYWHNFLSRRISPIMMDTLIDKGYDFKILSSTLLTFPEFRKTAFVRVPAFIEDSFETSDMTERDRIITDKLISYLSSHNREKPFFSYLFFNSSHQTYKYPPAFAKFRPVVEREEINYFTDADKEKMPMFKNRFKNAVYYTDHMIGKIITALEAKGLMDRTVLLITGDHGDEFYENGYFGHTSAFGDYQVKTVFVLHVPGAGARSIERLTSHMDFVPTVMELMGTITPAESYSQGLSLLGSKEHDYVSSANWDTASMIDNKVKIVYSTELYNIDCFEVRNKHDYTLVSDNKEIIKQKKPYLFDVLRSMTEFYK